MSPESVDIIMTKATLKLTNIANINFCLFIGR